MRKEHGVHTFFTAAEGLDMIGLLPLAVSLRHSTHELSLIRAHNLGPWEAVVQYPLDKLICGFFVVHSKLLSIA